MQPCVRRLLLATLAVAGVVLAWAAWMGLPARLAPSHGLPEPALAAGSVQAGGLRRTFLYYAPPGLARGAPLVFVLHGSRGSAEGMRALTAWGFERIAREQGAVVVYPQGVEDHWNDCRAGADYAANTRNIDDPAFFAAMIEWFGRELGVDRARVLVTGLSNGGHMAYRLGLERPDLVRAIAPIAASLPAPSNNDCSARGRAVAVVIINGTEDPVNPFAGGLVTVFGNDSRGEVRSSAATARYWAALAGHGDEPRVEELPDADPADGTRVRIERWSGGGAEVEHVIVAGGGHTVPTPGYRMPRMLGRTSHDIEAPALVWAFFRRQWPAGG